MISIDNRKLNDDEEDNILMGLYTLELEWMMNECKKVVKKSYCRKN
jgi:hypothetical protein